MGSGKKQTIGYKYFMGLHLGICHSPVDKVSRFIVGDRLAWQGSATASQSVYVDAPNLFGGDKKEGGVQGDMDIAMGESTQGQNNYLKSKIGATIPAFRGILGLIWKGGLISAMNPYIKPFAVTVTRITQGWNTGSAWYPEKAAITMGGSSTPISIAANATWEKQAASMGIAVAVPPSSGYTNANGPFTWPAREGLWIRKSITLPANHRLTLTVTAANSAIILANNSVLGKINEYNALMSSAGKKTVYYGPFSSAKTVVIAIKGSDYIQDSEGLPGPGNYLSVTGESAGVDNVCMNPAHIIYQCITDPVWGMGYPTSAIGPTFTTAADTLYAEEFGLSMLWNKQDSIENFIKTVLNHVGGILYVAPDTGQFELKLIRADYDRNTLPQYGPSNVISADDYQRQAWGETINEVTVVYTDHDTGKDAGITVQDLANITTQNSVVAQTKSYAGITHVPLAQRVALRDLYAVSTPTSKIKLSVNRKGWDRLPGSVFRLTWPDYSIDDVVFRVLSINTGTLQDGSISVECGEDIYGLPSNTYMTEQGSDWNDPSTVPTAVFSRRLLEVPYWDLARNLSEADLDYVDPLSGFVQVAAVSPAGDAWSYEIHSRVGSASYEEKGAGSFTPVAMLAAVVGKTDTTFYYSESDGIEGVVLNTYAVVGDEYVAVKGIDPILGTITVARGVLDTVPADHPIGTAIWFVEQSSGQDTTEYADGEEVDVKLLTMTALGTLAMADAPEDSIIIDQRQYRPYPPGKVEVGGVQYPDYIGGTDELVLTWAHRDRLTQTAYLVEQSEGNIGPEAGVTYTLRIYGETDTLLRTVTAIAGTNYTYTAANELADSGALGRLNGLLRFELEAVRGGLTSWQRHNHTVRREGYGFGYGYYYGGI